MESIFYTEEEQKYQKEAREFFEREVAPHVPSMDKEGKYPFEVLRKMAERHYIGVRFPSKYGGGGKDLMSETMVNEEAGAVSLAVACARSVPHHAAYCIWKHGSEAQRRKYLPAIFKAEGIISECISEPEVGSDAARMKTRAVREGDGYVISGEKRFQASGGVANILLVFAITNPNVHPTKGMSAFIVDRDTGNIHSHEAFNTLGYRGLRTVSELVFNGVKVPKENLVGEADKGFDALIDTLDQERVVVGGALVGTARACLEIALKYSAERVVFHRPLRAFEAISFRIADMALMVETARLMKTEAARMIDRGLKATKEAAMVKLLAAQTALKVSNDAIQILGGIGCTDKYPVERHFRDARVASIAGGSSEIMQLVIQREAYSEAGLLRAE